MTGNAEPELDDLDLVVRARRSASSTRERDALSRALAASATARTAHEIGADLDRATSVRAGDEALLERALEGALAGRSPIRRRRLPRVAAALAATLTLASAGAATRQVLVWRAEARMAEATRTRAADAKSQATSPAAPRLARPSHASAHPAAAAAPPPDTVAPARAHGPAPSATDAAAPARQATAADLFREAGAARRAGELARARASYLELVRQFPDSSEARVSRVSLGKLFLSAGNAREAEAAFAQYLRSGAADLREEALVGRADALMALGRSGEERSLRHELVRRYPASVYANRARERIAEIDGADGARSR